MIRHLSIDADDPARVAEALARLLKGRSAPSRTAEGSYLAMAGDGQGTAIEVYPMGIEIAPSESCGRLLVHNHGPSRYTATHVAMSVPASRAEIEELARREGWRTRHVRRGPVELIELWLENRVMLELIPPELEAAWDEPRASA